MSALPLAYIIARLAACPALAVLRDQDPSVAALVAVGGKLGNPNGTAATGASPYTDRGPGSAGCAAVGRAIQA